MAILTASTSSDGPITGWHLGDVVAPAGQHLAVCLGVKDSMAVTRPTYENPAVTETIDLTRFLFGIVALGQPMLVQTSEMKISGHEKSKLGAILTGWLGKPPVMDGSWDYCVMEGQPATLTITQKTSQRGRQYADVQAVSPVMAQLADQVPPKETFAALVQGATVDGPPPTQTFSTVPSEPLANSPHTQAPSPATPEGTVPFSTSTQTTIAGTGVTPPPTNPF